MKSPHKKTICVCAAWTVLSLFTFCAPAFAAENPLLSEGHGSIQGTVVSTITSEMLEGAEVTLTPSDRRIFTAREGVFRFGNVPAGEVQINVSYPGLTPQDITVVVEPGKVTELTVHLKNDEVIELDAFVVRGSQEGMSKAIAMQKSSDNTKVVAAADQFGDISGNMGEYLKFLPGVAADGFDGRNVSLRGMAPSLTSVTIDGTAVASASSSEMTRVSELETLSLSNVETIEVIKTLTPDQPATHTAGSVNLISKSAFDTEGNTGKYRIYAHIPGKPGLERRSGPGYTSGREMNYIRPNAELDYTYKITDNLGIYVGVRSYQSTTPKSERGQWTYEWNPQYGGLPYDPAPKQWTLRAEQNKRKNESASMRIDWKISPRSKWSISASWNKLEVDFHRENLEFYWGNRASLSPTSPLRYTVSTGNFVSNGGYVEAVVIDRRKKATAETYSTAFETMLSRDGVIKAEAFYNKSDNRYIDIDDGHFGQGTARISSVTLRSYQYPSSRPTDLTITRSSLPIDLDDITNYRMINAYAMQNVATEDRFGGTLSYTHRLNMIPLSVQVGGSWNRVDRKLDRRHLTTGSGNLIASGNATGMLSIRDDVASSMNGALGFPGNPAFVDLRKLWELYNDPASGLQAWRPLAYFSNLYYASFKEDTTAAYLRLDYKLGRNWLIVAGVRHEDVDGDNLNKLVNARGSFRKKGEFFSLNVKYTPSSKHVFRASVAQSMGLPDYQDILPESLRINHPDSSSGVDRGTVTMGNPDLKAYDVLNMDLSYDYFYRRTGFISLSLFRKSFKNYIIKGSQVLTDDLAASIGLDPSSLTSSVDQYDFVSNFNVRDKGYYNGIELSIGEQFSYLPRPFNTLRIQASLTLIHVDPIKTSETLIVDDPAQNASMLEQVEYGLKRDAMPVQASILISWRYKKIAILSTVTYSGRTLRNVSQQTIRYAKTTGSTTDFYDDQYMNTKEYDERRIVVNAKIEYRWRRYCVPYLQVRNLFNSKAKRTINGYYMYQLENSSPMYEIGLRGQF